MHADGVAETLRQIRDGRDFSAPKAILRVSAAAAIVKLAGWPYSLADNVAHTVYWQEIWLRRLRGVSGSPVMGEDWPMVPASQWEAVRTQFLSGLDEAIAFAEAGADIVVLSRIAHHDAYHAGQWALLKRLAKTQK